MESAGLTVEGNRRAAGFVSFLFISLRGYPVYLPNLKNALQTILESRAGTKGGECMEERRIDPDTGEILQQVTIYKRANEIVKAFDPVEAGRASKFIKVMNSQKAKRRLRKLTNAEAGFLLKILPYAAQGTNMLIGDGERGEKNKPLNVMDLYQVAGVHHTTGKQLYTSLKQKNVLNVANGEGIKKAIFLNPDYGVNGKKALPEIIEMFRNAVNVETLLSIDKEEE